MLEKSRLYRWVAFLWRNRWTPGGRTFFALFLIIGVSVAGLSVHRPAHLFLFLLAATVVVDWTVGWFFRPRVAGVRRLPDRVAVGAEFLATAEVVHTGRWPIYDVGLIEWRPPPPIRNVGEPTYVDRIAPGQRIVLSRRLVASRRGVHFLRGPAVVSTFPFGLRHKARLLRSPHRLLVYPHFHPLARLDVPTGRKHQPGGLQLVSAVGDSEEFLGNRDYRAGDRLRDLDHRAWARRGGPVVREFQQEYLTRIALLVDTRIDLRRAARPDFEAAISLGASVADALSRKEYVVDLFAAGPELYHFQAGRSLAYLDDILDVLATIGTIRRDPFARIGPALMERIEEMSTLIAVLTDFDDVRERFLASVQESGVAVKAVVVRSAPTTSSPAGFQAEGGPIRVLTAADVAAGIVEL